MNQGVIEQVGTPGEIYQDPATEFVADFIGNMNFLEGQVTGGIVKIGDWQFSSSKPKLVDDSTITIAIRPEDVIIEKGTNDRTNRIDAQIQSTEFLGSFVRLVLTSVQLDGQSFRADLPMTQMRDLALQSGDHIAASIQEQHVQIYLRPSKSKD